MASTTFVVGDDLGESVGSDPLQVGVTITEIDTNNDNVLDSLQVDLNVVSGFTADLRGFFFDVADDNLLNTLAVTGSDVNGYVLDTNNDGTPDISSAAPPPPEAQIEPLAFEAGIELGTPGASNDDIGSTTFVISSTAGNLTLADLIGESIGIRAQSVGENREGSSKLTGEVPPPDDDGGGGGGGGGEPNVSFEKDIDVSVDYELTSDVDIDLDKDVNVNVSISSEANVEGNTATAVFSAEAIGTGTFAEADVFVLAVEDTMSSVEGTLIAAVS